MILDSINYFKKHKLVIIFSSLLTIVINLNLSYSATLAQTESINPLEATEPDPILPPEFDERSSSSFEKTKIEREIVKIDREARAQLAAGNKDSAFDLWYRELRLARILGLQKEISALGRIGAIAWKENRGFDVRIINNRLITLEQEITDTTSLNLKLLNSLGTAYQQVRSLDRATNIYQQILVNTRQKKDRQSEREVLETLGKLYLARFDYQSAASIYEELIERANDNLKQEAYLNNLNIIYTKTLQLERAISTKQTLIEQYSNERQVGKIAALKIAIAQDYRSLNQLTSAIEYYQQAFALATANNRLAIATEALNKLGQLYLQSDRVNDALKTYQQLIAVQQQSYDSYGLMNTYERVGKIYQRQGNFSQAKAAWQKSLKLAQSLNYRVEYFRNILNGVQ